MDDHLRNPGNRLTQITLRIDLFISETDCGRLHGERDDGPGNTEPRGRFLSGREGRQLDNPVVSHLI